MPARKVETLVKTVLLVSTSVMFRLFLRYLDLRLLNKSEKTKILKQRVFDGLFNPLFLLR